jgi:hypothetical protein
MARHSESAGSPKRGDVHSDTFLRDSPRAMEVVCALVLGIVAFLFLWDVAMHAWFYWNYHQYYRSTPASRAYLWTLASSEILIGVWLSGLAIDLAHGATRRKDHGLFPPAALRAWGIVFALIPLVLIAAAWRTAMHVHELLWFWSAAVACFTLAARRSRSSETPDSQRPIE